MTISAYRLIDPLSPYVALKRHFPLIVQMAKRDVAGRYRGSFAGLFWSFFNPLLMLVIYTFVFGVIFKARWDSHVTGHLAFAVVLFAGLNINTLFTECANRAATLILDNPNFVKRVVFPLETLSWSVLAAGLFHLLISTFALLVIEVIAKGSIPWTIILFPVVVAVFLPFVAGSIWILASFGVFLRDLKQVVAIVTMALMFVAPIMYPMTMIPEPYRAWMYLNPLTVVAIASQDVLVFGRPPVWAHLGIYALAASAFAWAAFVWFEKTRKGFADVV